MSELRISILEILEKDSRTPPQEMAMQLGTTEKSVCDEIAAMEQEGIILKYNTIINSEKVDHDKRVLALIEVRVTPQRDLGFEGVAERIYRFEEVHSVYLMSGGYDPHGADGGRSRGRSPYLWRRSFPASMGLLAQQHTLY